jgi:hypothetical protein
MRHHPAPAARPVLVVVWEGRTCRWVAETPAAPHAEIPAAA